MQAPSCTATQHGCPGLNGTLVELACRRKSRLAPHRMRSKTSALPVSPPPTLHTSASAVCLRPLTEGQPARDRPSHLLQNTRPLPLPQPSLKLLLVPSNGLTLPINGLASP